MRLLSLTLAASLLAGCVASPASQQTLALLQSSCAGGNRAACDTIPQAQAKVGFEASQAGADVFVGVASLFVALIGGAASLAVGGGGYHHPHFHSHWR